MKMLLVNQLWSTNIAIFFPRELCCSNFVLTALFDMHSSNFLSKSWNSKYRVEKPSANAPLFGGCPFDSQTRAYGERTNTCNEFAELMRNVNGNRILPEVFHVLIRKILVRPPLLVHKLSTPLLKSRRRPLDAVILPKSNESFDKFWLSLMIRFFLWKRHFLQQNRKQMVI